MSALQDELKAVMAPELESLRAQIKQLTELVIAQAPVPKMLTTEEAAKRLDCSTETIRRKVRRGELKCVRIGNKMRFGPDDLVQ